MREDGNVLGSPARPQAPWKDYHKCPTELSPEACMVGYNCEVTKIGKWGIKRRKWGDPGRHAWGRQQGDGVGMGAGWGKGRKGKVIEKILKY